MLPDGSLADRVALVTGGGSGLGRAIAVELSRLGAKVAVLGRRPEPLEETVAQLAGEGFAAPADVRDHEAVARAFDAAEAALGPLTTVVNSAAGNFLVRAEDLSPNGWRAVVGIVLDGTFHCSRELGRRVIARGGANAQIVNIVASYAWTGGPGTVHSAAAKAGVVNLTRTLAVEWARHGVRVNAIAPGPVDTNLTLPLFAMPGAREEFLRHVPLGRIGRPEDIAQTILFLSSGAAEWVTGQCFYVDGGQSMVALPPYIDLVERLLGGKMDPRW